MSNQSIKCSVHTCKYNDKVNYCNLDSIKVGPDGANPHSKCDTECDSFADE